MSAAKATLPRVALAFAVGGFAWVIYRGVWGLWRYVDRSADDPGYDMWAFAPEVLGFSALVSAFEFVVCFVIAGLAWLALSGMPRWGWVRAGVIGAAAFYLVNATAFLFLPAYLLPPEGITWRSLLPGPMTIAHLTAAALVGVLIWRVAYGRQREHFVST